MEILDFNTYCDNDNLKNALMKIEPAECGLYPHELFFLWYSRFRRLKSSELNIKDEGCYNVSYVQLLFESLVERNYLKLTSDEELYNLLETLKNEELCSILDSKMIPNPSNKSERIRVLKTLTPEEIANALGYRFYIPTEKALIAIDKNQEIIDSRWQIWSNSKNNNATIKPIYVLKVYCAKIVFQNEKFYFSLNNSKNLYVCPKEYQFNNTIQLEVVYNQVSYGAFNCSKILLDNERILVIDNLKNEEYHCMLFGNNGIITESITDNDPAQKSHFDYERIECLDKKYNYSVEYKPKIIREGEFDLYFSLKNPLVLSILKSEKISKRVKIVDSFIKDEYSQNVCITIDTQNKYACNMINYLFWNRYIGTITIYKFVLYDYISIMLEAENYIAKINNESFILKTICPPEILEKISSQFKSLEEFVNIVCKHIPYEYLKKDSKQFLYKLDCEYNPFLYERNLESLNNKWAIELKHLIQELYTNKVITPRWKNEFSLFELVYNTFEDAIFQYRTEWLGKQSLDIYIPSLKTAIEYQGKQHFESIEYFGGEEVFQQQQIRDSKKMQLCNNNGVRLLYWSYDTPVTFESYKKFLYTNSLLNNPE